MEAIKTASTALKQIKTKKTEDKIICEMVKMSGSIVEETLQVLLNKNLNEERIPDAKEVLLFKKGDNTDIDNYRPISLSSHLYKLITKIIANRLTNN